MNPASRISIQKKGQVKVNHFNTKDVLAAGIKPLPVEAFDVADSRRLEQTAERLEKLVARLLGSDPSAEQVVHPFQDPGNLMAPDDHAQALSKTIAVLQRERDEAIESVERRFDEITILSQLLEAARTKIDSTQSQVRKLKQDSTALKDKGERVRVAHDRLSAKVKALQKELVDTQRTWQQNLDDTQKAHQQRLEGAQRTFQQRLDASCQVQAELIVRLQAEMAQPAWKKLGRSLRLWLQAVQDAGARGKSLRRGGKSFPGGLKELKRLASTLERSMLFDAEWYLAHYPDVAESGALAEVHYLKYGAAEQRDPGPLFSTKRYLDMNPDVARSKVNPLLHYIEFGNKERRAIELSQSK